jgi:hypothetical protein
MAMETDLVITARDALAQLAQQNLPRNDAAPAAASTPAPLAPAVPDEGVTLSLSAQGKLMAALATAVDKVTTAAVDSTEAAQAATVQALARSVADAAGPVTRATLFAIEARLVAARRGSDAIAAADAEVPPSNDPQRLRQARQATESLYGRADNPFAYKSRAELSAIVYDESGSYTVNERYAAANQRTELDQKFWAPVFQRALESGDWKPVITAALVFYASLSALEQTAYPDNYAQLLQQYLDLYQLQSPSSPSALPPQQQMDLGAHAGNPGAAAGPAGAGRWRDPGIGTAAPGTVAGRTDRRCTAPGRSAPGQQQRAGGPGQRLPDVAAAGLWRVTAGR